MKRINYCIVFIISCLVFMILLVGCDSKTNTNDYTEVSMNDYYKKDDFQFITIGESTYQDVYKVASTESMQVTSYGGFCEYPMQNGGYIRIKFFGRDLTVGDIEEVSMPIETD